MKRSCAAAPSFPCAAWRKQEADGGGGKLGNDDAFSVLGEQRGPQTERGNLPQRQNISGHVPLNAADPPPTTTPQASVPFIDVTTIMTGWKTIRKQA